ncbi:MAG: tRNA uridine-5-carboxymethylaminomethyl(34) synthesis GTPase MnmE [Puniceicoccales bacterium]|jgi:tRNA modification GTPase|nr:tRNA uridine-5-carboxymethylaminomethyl(34) synthesis GTPase MnmE [Puniceicoccales bacterium]
MEIAWRRDTFVALSTAVGRAALAVVRASGPLCGEIYREAFCREPVHRVASCLNYKSSSGEVLDSVVATFFKNPNSFTGDDMVEISCHGNPIIVEQIIGDMVIRGCRMAEPGEFTRRAFLNGKLDLSQAEAVAELIHGKTMAAVSRAGRQLCGELGRTLAAVREPLLDLLAAIESAIDFSDEGLPEPDWPQICEKLANLRRRVESLAETYRHKRHIDNGIGIVIAGAANAGKSSILNFLLARDRAIVSPVAGTTRDFIEESMQLGPWLLRLVDTAGICEQPSELDLLSMERSEEKIAEEDFVLLVVDGAGEVDGAAAMAERLHGKRGAIVFNKRDLPEFMPRQHGALDGLAWPAISISTKIPDDCVKLRNFIGDTLKANNLLPDCEDVSVNFRQMELLRASAAHLSAAEDLIVKFGPWPAVECVAEELHAANRALAEVVGEDVSRAVLDRIFSTFCVGK